MTKFQTAQKGDPNNALINRSVNKIKAQIKAQKNSKRTFERYTGATPATVSKLERDLKNVQDELDKEEKFPLGPIILPKPGPTLDMAEAEPDNAVTKSRPFKDSSVVKIKKMKKYRNIKVIIE